jgi:hypothetical protein
MEVEALAYVDIQVSTRLPLRRPLIPQHDALTVIDDVEQGVVGHEDIWVSGVSPPSSAQIC